MNKIQIRGARTHNLKNIDLDLPRDKLIVITGLSGSGKSSLAFDTIYAEGQRRYVESLSAYARQFLSLMEKPDIDHIDGLSPAISIEQKATSHNPRSTVGTVTEIHDYLRLLFARTGTPHCPQHNIALEAQTISEMVDQTLALPAGEKVMLLAPVIRERKGEYHTLFAELLRDGFLRARVDGEVIELENPPVLDKRYKHTIEVVIDRFKVRQDIRQRLAESFETALLLANDLAIITGMNTDKAKFDELLFSARYSCPHCDYNLEELEPRIFSFNNPAGACQQCDGLGTIEVFDPNLVIIDQSLSLAEGALCNWDSNSSWYMRMLESLTKHYSFDVTTPYKKLTKKIQQLLLYGSGEELVTFEYQNSRGGITSKSHPFEGVIPILERRYHDSQSTRARTHLSKFISTSKCAECNGSRLRQGSRFVLIDGKNITDISSLSIGSSYKLFQELELTGWRGEVAEKIINEISQRLGFLVNVGLDYLSLSRSADTLSGGEAQRIRLASQIGAGLVGVMYVLDEPSIGLHQRDNERLLQTLIKLRDLGNTVIVVEHDEDAIRAADFIVDIGVGAGVHGGEVVAKGTFQQVIKNKKSLTGKYLSGKKTIPLPEKRVVIDNKRVVALKGAIGNNLKKVTLTLPVGLFSCITGVSGSGKSTLINETLFPIVANQLNSSNRKSAGFSSIAGVELFDKVVNINQSPIGRTPRSNPATYTGIFTPIRELFAATPESRARGYKPGRFSFNVKGGRCEACQGDGVIKVEMHFLPDIFVPCDHCKGKRYNRESLEIHYKGKTIDQVLEMTVEDAREFFDPIPVIAHKLQTLLDVGLSYIRLGQNATTLSGGEAQRVKLARELSKRDTGNTLYILDEPTTGLHFHDIQQLLTVLLRLRDHGNTIVVIEHNLDVIKTADWIIDLGPEGGDNGGEIIASGTPEQVAMQKHSYTGQFLQPLVTSS